MTDTASTITPAQQAFSTMLLIRRVEERLLQLFAERKITGTVHTCIGQEASAVGVVGALTSPSDVVWSNHRGHGHYLAYSNDAEGLIAEIMGRRNGVGRGIGGSQHLHRDGFYSNGILGSTAPCAVGSAFAEHTLQTGAVTVVFLGDGAMAEGAVAEAMNIAALWKLPVLFVVEHNGIAQTTPTELEIAGNIAQRGAPYGIKSVEMNATDVTEVRAATDALVAGMRNGEGPAYLVLHTYRLMAHSKGDDTRTAEDIAALRAIDPLIHLHAQLSERDEAWVKAQETTVELRIDQAVAAAEAEGPLSLKEWTER